MDGMRGGSPVSMSMGGMMGNRNMAGNAGTSGLAAAMGEFLNSPANVSGLSTAEMTALMTKLANSNGRM
jgi:hypothetical protein